MNEVVKIKFSTQDCRPCSLRTQCTRAKAGRRTLSIRPEAQYKALQAARLRDQSEAFQTQYAQRAGIEGTLAQGVRICGLRQARYIGLAKTHLFTACSHRRCPQHDAGGPLAQCRTFGPNPYLGLCTTARRTPLAAEVRQQYHCW
jgi:transposase